MKPQKPGPDSVSPANASVRPPELTFQTPDQFSLWQKHKVGDRSATDRLIELNSGLVPYYRPEVHDPNFGDDLFQAGRFGIWRALDGFDPYLGWRFSTYCCNWIRSSVDRERIEHNSAIRISLNGARELKSIDNARQHLEADRGILPDDGELARFIGIAESRLAELQFADSVADRQRCLDDPDAWEDADHADRWNGWAGDADDWGHSANPALDQIVDSDLLPVEEVAVDRVHSDQMELVLASLLSARQQAVLKLKFGLGGGDCLSFRAIGQEFGVSGEAARRMCDRTLKKLRQHPEFIRLLGGVLADEDETPGID